MPRTRTLEEQIQIAQDKKQQHENRIKELIQKQKEQERKARTRRLIERGAMLEKRIAGAETLTNDQIGVFLDKTLLTPFSKKILAEITVQRDSAEARPNAGGADTPNGGADTAGMAS